MITVEYLTRVANDFLKNYDMELDIPIKINPRLKNCQGYFAYNDYEPLRIEVAKLMLDYGHIDLIDDTIRHECLHYALYMLGEPFDDDDEYFISEAKRLGVGLTEEFYVGVEYQVECVSCGKSSFTSVKKMIDEKYIGNKYTMKCCGGSYVHTKNIIYNGYGALVEEVLTA